LAGVRKVLFGGEKVSVPHVRQALKVMGASKLIHVYGPTESTVFATAYPVAAVEEGAATVPIGKPISNTEAYVLDSSLRIQPQGVPGELCLSGAGLAKGYLNQPELTAERFVDHPYAPGEKLYRTGDLVRLLEDGNIEYIGRMDQQVKIRGFRIEPGEIAARLREHPSVLDATVVALQENDNGAHFLCAYYTVQRPVSTSQLRVHLEAELPDYMVPSYFCELEQLALSANGKVDKAALPRPDFTQLSEAPYIAPRNTVESALVGIWEEILGVQGIGVVDHFFQRGGHSLKVTMLVSRIQAELQVELPLREVFQYPTIEGLAKRIMNDSGSDKQSIPIAGERKVYPASSAQKRLYIMNQFHESGKTYNLPCMTHIRGSLDFERISQALRALVERHEALRTSFYTVDDEVVQRVHQKVDLPVELIDMQAENVRSYVQQFIKPFNLQQAPLMRAEVLRLADEEFVLMLDFHHIVSDGVSINLFMKELKAIYAGASFEQSRIQYKDYAVWQQERSNSEAMMKQEAYWLSRFDGNIPTLELPADYPRPAAKNFEGDRLSFLLERSVVEQLELLCKQQGTTMFMTLLAAYHVFLFRYTGQTDIVVGTPIAARLQIELESMMGMFVNTLPLRNNPASSARFAEFLQDIKMNTLQAFENQEYPLEQLIAKLELERDVSRNPLFDTMFTLQNMDMEKMDIEGLSLSPYPYEMNIAKFDLLLAAIETDDGLLFEMEFATSLFSHDTVQRMSRYFTELLRNIARNPNLPISEYPLLTEPEQHALLHAWNETGTSYPKSRTLSQLFEAQTERSPGRLALAFEDRTLTYQELNKQANRFACLLREKGIRANTVVSLLFNRSVDMIIAILGVLKAGGAYLPIDPDYPSDRIEYMLQDSHARLLITDGSVSNEFAFAGETCVWRDLKLVRFPETNLEPGCTTEDAACVMYTSGSTGRPKGILTAHYSISRVVMNTNYIAIQPEDRMLQLSNYVFDGSLFDIFGALLNGAQLRLLTKETLLDIEALSECIHREQITVFFITTALFNTLVDINADALRNVRRILFGGEKVSVRHVRQALSSIGANKLIHVYGPTESTVFATFHPINEIEETAATVPIGRPIANTGAYVLSPDRQLSPIGVPGELYLSGDGLSQGYLNNPVLTAEKFVPHPFVPGERLYRTGDRVKLLPSGDIEYMERIDHMVKIRGFRIELGEIADRLLACEAVKEAIVVTQNDDSGQPCICAYFVAAGPWSTAELREQLACSLPSYMIPDHFRPMDELPLTPNGKVDRKKLPMPDFSAAASKAYEAPITSVEKRLSQMFGELFGLETVGRNADFFALGGHSLKASLLLSRIRTEFQMTISLSDIFRRPVIRDLAAVIEAGTDEPAFVIEPADFRKEYPASYAQKRIYFVHELDKGNVAYNMPIWLRSETALDFARLQHSFQQLIDRHESLRTIFRMVEGELVQQICERVEFTIQKINVGSGESTADVNLIKPFDLGHAPLIRAVLFHEAGGGQVLMIDIHHIVSDGVSVGVLLRELRALYECRELSPLALQYKDFSVWQQQYAQTEAWALSEHYWLEMFQGEVPLLQLPTDYPRPLIQRFEGSRVSLHVDGRIGLNIRMLSSQWQMTPFILYMSAYTWLVSLYSGQDDMVIGTPTTGRKHLSLDGVVGMFANVLPLRMFPGKEQSFHAFAQQVKERVICAHTHQEYALQNLLEKAQLRRDMSRNPLFDTVLTYQQRQDDEYRLGNHRMTEKDGGGNTSKFDLTLSVSESENGELFLDLEYSTALFKRSTVERMAGHFVRLLEQIVHRPELRLSEADIVTEQEREQLLRTFNDTSVAHRTESMVHEHFEQQAERVPNRPAVVWREEMWTYRELNERSNRIAHALRRRGAAPDAIVGILMERSPDMIAGMLGILKSGAAYMPIDPEYPAERIAHMLRDSGTKLVLTHRG
ncbi:non-ribosomal peptide synthetase, partial [Paenibacillus algorifonticola]